MSKLIFEAERIFFLILHASRYLGETYSLSLVSVAINPVFSGLAPLVNPYPSGPPSGNFSPLSIEELEINTLSVTNRVWIFALSVTVSLAVVKKFDRPLSRFCCAELLLTEGITLTTLLETLFSMSLISTALDSEDLRTLGTFNVVDDCPPA